MEASFRSVIERVLSICSLLLISGWFLSTFLPQGDTWGLFGILSAAILCCLWWKAPIECSIIDAGIIVVWAYDLLSLAWSINSSPTIIFLYMETTAVVCYFLVRHLSRTENGIRRLLGILCTIIGIVVFVGLGTFWFYVDALKEIDIENIYFFRHLYRPFGLPRTIGPACYGFSEGSSPLPIRFSMQSEYNDGFSFSGFAFYL